MEDSHAALDMTATLALLAGCAGDAPTEDRFDPVLAGELQAALDASRDEIDAPGAVLAVLHPDEGEWVGTSGVSDLATGDPVTPGDLFRIGSITKVYVAVVLLQLEDEGALRLDDPLADWVAWAPHADRITVRQLLQHTSGLTDHVDDLAFLAELGEEWTAAEMVALVADEPLLFEPGTGFSYSNTGYILLGEVIGAATGRSWGEEVRDRILEPLGLTATWVPSLGETPPIVRGYLGTGADLIDVTDLMHPTAPGAGGELVATARDVARFAHALFVDGALLTETQRIAMTTPAELSDGPSPYGLGLYLTPRGDLRLIGHSGSTMGFQSRVHILEGTGIVAATTVDNFYAEADVIDAAAWDILDR